jgi:hypothetical protein
MGAIEVLAEVEHKRWSRWMKYLFGVSKLNDDGSVTIPMAFVKRWTRQMNTDYKNLTEEEKESDRKEVDRTIAALSTLP